ncbi:MAG: hypothetical protein FD156_1766 [Nitrospirae bacterium]|nr:MAG: hypothetical protein FD156_1766 [Nitrospirota bacterium]
MGIEIRQKLGEVSDLGSLLLGHVKPIMLIMAGIMVAMKMVLLGKRSEYDY